MILDSSALVAVFLGRFVRFLVLSMLVLWFGPEIVVLFGEIVKGHWAWVLAAAVAGVFLWLVLRRKKVGEHSGQ